MLGNKTNCLGTANSDVSGTGDGESVISEVITASVDEGTERVAQPRVTFADRVRISGSPRNSPNHRRRPGLHPSRDLFSSDTLRGRRTPSPSLSRSSSLSDTASSLSAPLRPPSLVTPQAYAFSFSHRHRKSANFSGPSLSAIMSSSDASNFLAGLRGSIKRPQKQHATIGDDYDGQDSILQAEDEEDEDQDADETTPLKRPPGARRNQQTLGSMARQRRQYGDEDDSGNDRLWSCFPCVICKWWAGTSPSTEHLYAPDNENEED